jgi:hypothetical protein
MRCFRVAFAEANSGVACRRRDGVDPAEARGRLTALRGAPQR